MPMQCTISAQQHLRLHRLAHAGAAMGRAGEAVMQTCSLPRPPHTTPAGPGTLVHASVHNLCRHVYKPNHTQAGTRGGRAGKLLPTGCRGCAASRTAVGLPPLNTLLALQPTLGPAHSPPPSASPSLAGLFAHAAAPPSPEKQGPPAAQCAWAGPRGRAGGGGGGPARCGTCCTPRGAAAL